VTRARTKASAAALAALLSGLPLSATAQLRGNPARPMQLDTRAMGPRAHAARQLPAPQGQSAAEPTAAKTGAQPAVHQTTSLQGAPAQGALVVPVRSSTELTGPAGGAIPATQITTSPMPGAPMGPGGMGVQLPAPRQPLSDVLPAPGTVRITIRAISARSGPVLEIDGRLGPIDRDLRSFADQFSYRNYRLLDVQTFDLDFRSIAQMELPGQRAIEVEPRQLGPDGRVKVHLELLGVHPEHAPQMRTDYSIPRGRTILVGGYRIDPRAPDSGTLLLAITQDEE
jgi:hypothetical protein